MGDDADGDDTPTHERLAEIRAAWEAWIAASVFDPGMPRDLRSAIPELLAEVERLRGGGAGGAGKVRENRRDDWQSGVRGRHAEHDPTGAVVGVLLRDRQNHPRGAVMRWRCVRPPPLPAPRLATAGGSARWNFAPGAVLTLEVRFLDRPNSTYSAAALSAANSWPGAVRFVETSGPGVIRVASDPAGGGWSQIGSDAARVPFPLPTMNLALDAGHPDFAGHAAHEFGHARGYDHTHRQESIRAGLIRPRVEADYAAEFGWTAADVYDAVFRPLDPSELAPPADWHSVLSYPFTAAQRVAGVATGGGVAVSALDAAFDLATYPLPTPVPVPPVPPPPEADPMRFHYAVFDGAGSFVFDSGRPSAGWSGFNAAPYKTISIAPNGSALMTFEGVSGVWMFDPNTGYNGRVHDTTPARLG